jgi:hypothetical protein
MKIYLANLVQELRVCELPIVTGFVALPIHGNFVPVPRLHIAVQCIVAYVGLPTFEPLPVPKATSNHQDPFNLTPLESRNNH